MYLWTELNMIKSSAGKMVSVMKYKHLSTLKHQLSRIFFVFKPHLSLEKEFLNTEQEPPAPSRISWFTVIAGFTVHFVGRTLESSGGKISPGLLLTNFVYLSFLHAFCLKQYWFIFFFLHMQIEVTLPYAATLSQKYKPTTTLKLCLPWKISTGTLVKLLEVQTALFSLLL